DDGWRRYLGHACGVHPLYVDFLGGWRVSRTAAQAAGRQGARAEEGQGAKPYASRRRTRCAMIIGIGSDLIDIRRIEKAIQRHGDRFIQRIFTLIEQDKSDRRKLRAASYAKRFAAKEACSKALG